MFMARWESYRCTYVGMLLRLPCLPPATTRRCLRELAARHSCQLVCPSCCRGAASVGGFNPLGKLFAGCPDNAFQKVRLPVTAGPYVLRLAELFQHSLPATRAWHSGACLDCHAA